MLELWEAEGRMHCILEPGTMQWLRHITGVLRDLCDSSDPIYAGTSREVAAEAEARCEEIGEDGVPCGFVGTRATLGVHRYYHHGKCNPAKALVLTNQCPGCEGVHRTLRSAKEHASRSLKLGRCSRREAAKTYGSTYAIEQIETGKQCPQVVLNWEDTNRPWRIFVATS